MTDNATVRLISYLKVRRAIGILGMLLPLVVYVGALAIDQVSLLPSISDYYYTGMRNIFVGTLCALSVFLFSYKGYDSGRDNLITNLAAVCALGVAFLPTAFAGGNMTQECIDVQPTLIHHLHFAFAGLLFLTLGYYSAFYFVKSDEEVKGNKRIRNRIYTLCGYTMIGLVVFTGITKAFSFIPFTNYIFFVESLCLLTFGFSWLIKGETLWKDS